MHIVEFKSNYQSTNVWKSWPLWGKQENVHQNSCYVAISLSHSLVTKIGSLDFGMTKNKYGPFFKKNFHKAYKLKKKINKETAVKASQFDCVRVCSLFSLPQDFFLSVSHYLKPVCKGNGLCLK